jgi:hypothetical protein
MSPTRTEAGRSREPGSQAAPGGSSALEWLWKYLSDIRHPRFLDCGSVSPSTIKVLLKRNVKIYVADAVSALQRSDPGLWKTEGKKLVFDSDRFLKRLPPIPPASLAVICGWHVLDLIPREFRSDLVARLFGLLEPGGVLFCVLREPSLTVGMDTYWWFESLYSLGMAGSGQRPFPYPAVSNREVEQLIPEASVKTFLTRSGRREVVILKQK